MKCSNMDSWISKSENLSPFSRDSLEQLTLSRLNSVLYKCASHGGFYSEFPSHIDSISDLSSLPFTTAQDVASRSKDLLLVSQSEIDRIITDETSGTSGDAKRVFFTSEDLDRTVDFFSCGLSEFIDSRDATLICMPSQKQGSVGELISRAIAARGASPHIFSVGRSFAEMLHDVRRFGITTMVAMPAPLLSFAKYARASGVALNIHDVLVSADACPDELISQITALLSCGIFPHYGLREGCLGCAVTCSAHEGMHIRENDLYCEVIADDGAVLPDGEFGELVITTLTRRAMPLVRYRTGDYTRILAQPCPCGSAIRRLDRVVRSRANLVDMAKLDAVLSPCENILDFSASFNGCSLSLYVESIGELSENTIRRFVEPLLSERDKLTVSIREFDKNNSQPLYIGKRVVRMGG